MTCQFGSKGDCYENTFNFYFEFYNPLLSLPKNTAKDIRFLLFFENDFEIITIQILLILMN